LVKPDRNVREQPDERHANRNQPDRNKRGDYFDAKRAKEIPGHRLVALAAKGNGPAQRAAIEAIQAIEREVAAQAAVEAKDKPNAGCVASMPLSITAQLMFWHDTLRRYGLRSGE
jgi:hypothetical protein